MGTRTYLYVGEISEMLKGNIKCDTTLPNICILWGDFNLNWVEIWFWKSSPPLGISPRPCYTISWSIICSWIICIIYISYITCDIHMIFKIEQYFHWKFDSRRCWDISMRYLLAPKSKACSGGVAGRLQGHYRGPPAPLRKIIKIKVSSPHHLINGKWIIHLNATLVTSNWCQSPTAFTQS